MDDDQYFRVFDKHQHRDIEEDLAIIGLLDLAQSKVKPKSYDALVTKTESRERCLIRMEADEVILFYWPPTLTSRDICAGNGYGTAITVSTNTIFPSIITTSAITFKGPDTFPLYGDFIQYLMSE